MCIFNRIDGEVVNSDCHGGCADYFVLIPAVFAARDLAAEVVSELQAAADKAAQVAVKSASYNATTRAAATSRAYWAAVNIGRVTVLVEWVDGLLDEQNFAPLDDALHLLKAELNRIKTAA